MAVQCFHSWFQLTISYILHISRCDPIHGMSVLVVRLLLWPGITIYTFRTDKNETIAGFKQ